MAPKMTIHALVLLSIFGLLTRISLAQTPKSMSSSDVAAMINQATHSGTEGADIDEALDQLSDGPTSSNEDILAALNQADTHTTKDADIPPSPPPQSLGNTTGNDGATGDAAPMGSAVPAGAFPPQKAGLGGSAASAPTSGASAVKITYVFVVAMVTGFFAI